MKKILSIIPLIAFAAALNATEVVVTPTSTDRQSIVVPEHTSNADTLTLNSKSYEKYTADPKTTYASVRAIKGEGSGNANFAWGTLIIDANTEEANYTALSAAKWTHNLFTLNFKNSASSSTPIAVNFGSELNIYSGSDKSVQKQYIIFDDTTYNVSATTVTIGNNINSGKNTSTFTVNSGSRVNWTGTTFYIRQSGIVDVYGRLDVGGTVHLDQAGAALNIKNGAKFVFTAPKAFKMVEGTTMTIGSGSTVTFVPGNTLTLGGTITSASALNFYLIDSATGTFTQTSGGVQFFRPATFNSGADWTAYDKITLKGSDETVDRTATVTVNSGADFAVQNANPATHTGRIIFSGNNNLVLNKANAITDESGNPTKLVTVSGTKNNRMTVNADQDFFRVYVNNSDLSVYMNNTAVLRFTEEGFVSSNGAFMHVYNFREESLYIAYSESMAESVANYVKLYDGDETFLGMATLGTDGWVTLAIPEPATYAAFFGLLALGFAAYRRRK